MKKVYVLLDDEPLDRRSLTIVDSEDKAKLLVEKSKWYLSYQTVTLMSDWDVKDMICDEYLGKMEDFEEFMEIHCNDCDVGYNEVCPFIGGLE